MRTGAAAVSASQEAIEDAGLVELPGHPPLLTPGLARALGRVIAKASQAADSEVHALDGSEVLAS